MIHQILKAHLAEFLFLVFYFQKLIIETPLDGLLFTHGVNQDLVPSRYPKGNKSFRPHFKTTTLGVAPQLIKQMEHAFRYHLRFMNAISNIKGSFGSISIFGF